MSLTNPLVYGFFTEEEPLKKAIESLKEDKSLYFIGHKLKDIDFIPENSFGPISKGQGVKSENVDKLRYLIIDIDPTNNTEVVNGERKKRNLTAKENKQIIKEAMALRAELLNEGFKSIGVINSGNGAYLVFPFKGISNTEENIKLEKQFAKILKKRYSFSTAQIDTEAIKATQCFKLPGTLSTKGEATGDNPYRHAEIVEEWDANQSCWKAIQGYVDKYAVDDLVISSSGGDELNLPACMQHCQKFYPVFRGENHDYRVRVKNKGKIRDMKLDSVDFASELRIHLRSETGILDIDKSDIDAIITFLKDEAYQKEVSVLASRAYYDRENQIVYYDMCNGKEVVKITSTDVTYDDNPMGMFSQSPTDEEQVRFTETPAEKLPELLGQVVNVSGNNLLLLAVYLCLCFLGNFFPMSLMAIIGRQGSSKTSLTTIIQRIVHPQKVSLLSLSAKIKDISIALSTRLLTCFDNASGIKTEVADVLCSAVTKGCFQTRELYTTADERLIEYKSIIVINSLDIITKRPDLMQRAVLLELEPIKPEKRKTQKEVMTTFEKLLPEILGAIFNAIQKVLAMGEIELSALSRMADAEEWGAKFAVALGVGADEYQKMLFANQQSVIDAVSFGNPVIFTVVELMHNRENYNSPSQNFYTTCYNILKQKATPNELAQFPKNASTLSRALNGLEENLKAFGITYEKENVGPYKEVRITNDGSVIPNSSAGEVAGKLAYEKDKQDK